jgi:hypothetical protein
MGHPIAVIPVPVKGLAQGTAGTVTSKFRQIPGLAPQRFAA